MSAENVLATQLAVGTVLQFTDYDSGEPVPLIVEANPGGAPTGPAGGDLTGTYPNPDVQSISANIGGEVPIVSPIAIGTGAAVTGTVRLPQSGSVTARNAAGTGDQTLIATDGADDVLVGDPNSPTTTIDAGTNISLGTHPIPVDVTGTVSIFNGGSASATGSLRLPNGAAKGVNARNVGNTADVILVALDAGNSVEIATDANNNGVIIGGVGTSNPQTIHGIITQDIIAPANGPAEYLGANGSGAVVALGTPGTAAFNAAWYAVTDIYWDPAGTAGGSDTNTGTTIGAPLLTFKEIVRRYGSPRPQMNYGQNVTVHQLTAQPAGADPVFFEPSCSGGGYVALIGTLAAQGGISSSVTVTPKNRATATRLQITVFSSIVAGNLVFNQTRNSYAWVDSVAAGVATMSQPIPASVITTIAIPTLSEDDTWTTGDTFQAYTVPSTNLKLWKPFGGDVVGAAASLSWVQWVTIVDPGATVSVYTHHSDSAAAVLSCCAVQGRLNYSAGGGRGFVTYAIGCNCTGLVNCVAGYQHSFYGGIAHAGWQSAAGGADIDGDAAIHTSMNLLDGQLICGNVFSDGAWTIQGVAQLRMNNILWGAASVQLNPGGTFWNASGTTWASQLLFSGGLKLGANTTGTKYAAGAWTDGVNLTTANLDTDTGLQDPQTGARYCMGT